jgi:hypothetical protein
MSGGYISLFTNSNNFSDADLQNALPDLQSQVANEFNYYWGMYAYLDDSGSGTPLFITDYGGDPGYLGFHTIDGNYNPYAIVYADVCVQYNTPVTGVISHELLEMMADPLVDTVDLYDNGDGTGFIVDQEVCDPCEMSLYYEAPNGNIVSDFVTPAWFVPGDPNPVDFLGAIPGPWQLASGGYVCYQDVTLSGLVCVAGERIQRTIAKARETIKRVDNPHTELIRQLRSKGRLVQPPKIGPITVVKRQDVHRVSRAGQTPQARPEPPAAPTRVPARAQRVPAKE